MKKLLSLILALVTLSSLFFTVNVSAASWPSLGAYSYCEITAPKTINVYTSMYLNTRGTSSPSKQYNAYIDKGDICKIYRIESNFIHLAYPTSSGYKQGFVKRSDMFGVSSPSEYFTSKGKATTYKYAGSSSYGNTAKGDDIYKVGTSGSYTQIIYTAKSGNRAYKAGWVKNSDYNNVLKKVTPDVITPTDTSLTNALYKINIGSSKISCGFDGYVTTSGRHEGIDFDYQNGKSIYSLTNGIITNVVEGRDGGALSTIAIYDSANNKTVIYLHSNPSDSLYVGKSIKKGDKIGTESWRGCSSSNGGHTHVEVRNGRKTNAAKSVNDYTLDNSNPKSYWQGMGYTVK